MNKAVFLDRDGTLNVDKGYLYKVDDFEWIPGVLEGLKKLHDLGYLLIVVTNQSGVARGYYTEEDVQKLHQWMCADAAKAGVPIKACYYCPYLPGAPIAAYDQDSDWRKPKPGMVLQALEDYDIDPAQSIMIGDKERDVACGEAAGVKGYLFTGGDFHAFVNGILAERRQHGEL